MTAEVYAGASSAGQVFRLQTRIAKAIKAGRYNKAKVLQWILAHSFSAKYFAVNKVTQNKDILSLLLVHYWTYAGLSRVLGNSHARFLGE